MLSKLWSCLPSERFWGELTKHLETSKAGCVSSALGHHKVLHQLLWLPRTLCSGKRTRWRRRPMEHSFMFQLISATPPLFLLSLTPLSFPFPSFLHVALLCRFGIWDLKSATAVVCRSEHAPLAATWSRLSEMSVVALELNSVRRKSFCMTVCLICLVFAWSLQIIKISAVYHPQTDDKMLLCCLTHLFSTTSDEASQNRTKCFFPFDSFVKFFSDKSL